MPFFDMPLRFRYAVSPPLIDDSTPALFSPADALITLPRYAILLADTELPPPCRAR